jgi:hypothetical protein
MNHPSLHLARPGQLPAPSTGQDSLQVLTDAIDALARQRTAYWLGDSAVHLHALTSLIAQAQQLLPEAVHGARDQELTWTQIGELLGTTAATQPAATRTSHDQLDKDHRHNAEMSMYRTVLVALAICSWPGGRMRSVPGIHWRARAPRRLPRAVTPGRRRSRRWRGTASWRS